jgi:hypothetical protein
MHVQHLPSSLGHLQRADASCPRVSIWSDPRRLRTLQRCDASGSTRPARRIDPSNLGHRCVGLCVSSRMGLAPVWERLNGRERCWSKAGRATWPSVVSPHRFDQPPSIGSLLRCLTHDEVTSMPTLGPPRRHPMSSGLFKPAAAGQSGTLTLPSSNCSSPHNRRDHGQRNWIEGKAARAPNRPWPWRQASRDRGGSRGGDA